MLMEYNRVIILIGIIITATACSHRPPNVIAQIPLLSAAYTKNQQQICSLIINNTKKYSLICNHEKFYFQPIQRYVSALGKQCMKGVAMKISGTENIRVFCQASIKNEEKWYLVPSVITNLDDIK
ncbi:hypothetical protein [Photobacterium phosphoreum]|jgi:hypothetical protein|uniref:hypothetical protein n=1 Tax=Photobacterium phosphoreum TaxID=659 RepID=UPI000D4F6977|nr:hypothetical protein [Photobacterium phosphoreum]MCD9475595.1 hypothetical protein [Photobacterium phosphoreum]MCD9504158.1 hypothetical protein [Photobacterium phosphoreum]MCF2177623.1 hypothetical protein [Photobacterium phosphoreum]PSU54835.1 hypothetical protein CTM75_20255 [Photobacterium phosphoreum]